MSDKPTVGKRMSTQRPKANTDINNILIAETRSDLVDVKITAVEATTSVRFLRETISQLEQSRKDQGRRLGQLEMTVAKHNKIIYLMVGSGALGAGLTGLVMKILGN